MPDHGREGMLTRIAQIESEESVDFTSFSAEHDGLGSKKRFHPPDFNGFHANPLVHNDLRHFWPVSYGKSRFTAMVDDSGQFCVVRTNTENQVIAELADLVDIELPDG